MGWERGCLDEEGLGRQRVKIPAVRGEWDRANSCLGLTSLHL